MNLQFPASLLPPTPLVFSFKWFRMQWIIRKFLCDLACRVLIRPGQDGPGKSNRNESRPLVPLSKGQIRSTMRAGVVPPQHTHVSKGTTASPPPLSLYPTPHASLPRPLQSRAVKTAFQVQRSKKIKRWDKTFGFPFFVYTFGWGYNECEGNIIMCINISYIFLKSRKVSEISKVFLNSKGGKRKIE